MVKTNETKKEKKVRKKAHIQNIFNTDFKSQI